MDLQLFGHEILCYWTGTPNQHRQTNRLCRRMQISAAQWELSRNNGERLLAHGYGCVPRAEWLGRSSATVLPNGAHVGYKGDHGLWWLGNISASTSTKGVYLVSIDVFSPFRIGPFSFPFCSAFLVGFDASPFGGVGVGCEEPHLGHMFYFVESRFPPIVPYFCIYGSLEWASVTVLP